jgi:putative membrane protein
MLVVNICNLAREIQVGIAEPDAVSREEKQKVLNWLSAFAIATKLHLRQQSINNELDTLTGTEVRSHLVQSHNPPLALLLFISDYLQQQCQQQRLDSSQRYLLAELLNNLVEGVTNCERILTTPMPIAYSVYLKRLIIIYCGLLPFSLVEGLHWWTGPIVATISFVLLGIEEIGNEIEDPFGTDPNDLPLDDICKTVLDCVESAKQFTLGCSQTALLENGSFPPTHPVAQIEMHPSLSLENQEA